MYILFFLLELINIYVIFNVTLKSLTWFTTSVQVPTLNYLNNIVNVPTKYLLLPHLHNNTSDDDTSDDDTMDDTSETTTEDDTTEDDTTDNETIKENSSESETSDSESSDSDTIKKLDTQDKKLEHSISDGDSSDSDDKVKSLQIKPSVIIMDEKLD